jgi:hypothetical protein
MQTLEIQLEEMRGMGEGICSACSSDAEGNAYELNDRGSTAGTDSSLGSHVRSAYACDQRVQGTKRPECEALNWHQTNAEVEFTPTPQMRFPRGALSYQALHSQHLHKIYKSEVIQWFGFSLNENIEDGLSGH